MRYTLFLHYPEMTTDELGDEAIKAGMTAFHRYAVALDEAGVLRSAEVLTPSAVAVTVAVRDGETLIHDGPFAETREQIGGSFVIEVPDRETAIRWAERCPSAQWGTVEIRPAAVRFVDGGWVPVT